MKYYITFFLINQIYLFAFFKLYCYNVHREGIMENRNVENFLLSCQDLIECKFLVAEYKLQKMLQDLADASEICSLIGECLEQFNREREFAKAYVQDSNGECMFVLPDEEYKIIALVFCTLMDIDAKKIDFTDFVKRFFGKDDNAYGNFVDSMIVPFRDLIAEAFGYKMKSENLSEEMPQSYDETEDYEEGEDEDKEIDIFEYAQKIAVQILGQLEYAKQDDNVKDAKKICRAIVKTTDLKDYDISESLAFALKCCKLKQVKFLVKELYELFD